MTRNLLAWNINLTKQGDRSSERTPLHFAASWGFIYRRQKPAPIQGCRTAKLLLEADESSAYQSDSNGLFPIHAAALGMNVQIVHLLLLKCPDCAQLRDGQGRTFLHIAVENGSLTLLMIHSLLLQGNQMRTFAAAILNAQDHEGNTALHFAARAGRPGILYKLISNKEVQLNLQNKKGQTALDLSWSQIPSGVFFALDPKIIIQKLLRNAGAKYGVQRGDENAHAHQLNMKEEAKKIQDSTTTIGVVSVLIITISFAAAFQVPGGYSTGNKPAGTPELASRYSFEAFLVANTLALLCGTIATISLLFAGVPHVDISIRMKAFLASIFFLNSSARSLAAAFAFGTQAVLAPVAHAASVLTWISVGFMLLDVAWFTYMHFMLDFVLITRRGIRVCPGIACSIVTVPLLALWPYIVIAGFIAYLKTHGIH